MIVSLIGYRGTGKTTVGYLLAEKLGWTCIDTDAQIEHDARASIRQIFESQGEERFRDYETAVISKLLQRHKLVLALGGGAILREKNRNAITMAGPVVWLKASVEELHRRISDDATSSTQRPNLTADGGITEIANVLQMRTPIYQACADCEIDTQKQYSQ